MSVYTSTTCATDNVAQVAELGESAYVPRQRLFLGLRYQFIIRDQIGNPMEIFVDRKDQIWTFVNGFGSILQRGQVVRFECDMLGLHGYIHGQYPEVRDRNGKRVMPGHGNPIFDAFLSALDVSPQVQQELRAWEEYTAHNPDWYLRKTKARMKNHN